MITEQITKELASRCENYIDELYQGKHYELSRVYRDAWHTCMMCCEQIMKKELKQLDDKLILMAEMTVQLHEKLERTLDNERQQN